LEEREAEKRDPGNEVDQDHPPKYVVTSGLNFAKQLVSQSEKNGVSLGEDFPLFSNHQVRVLSY